MNVIILKGSLKIILTEFAPKPLGLYAVKLSRQFTPAKVNALIDFLKEELTGSNQKPLLMQIFILKKPG